MVGGQKKVKETCLGKHYIYIFTILLLLATCFWCDPLQCLGLSSQLAGAKYRGRGPTHHWHMAGSK